MTNARLSHRLITAFMFMALIVALTGAYGIHTIGQVSDRVQDTMKGQAAREKMVVLMRSSLQEARNFLLGSTLVRSSAELSQIRDDYTAKRDLFRSYLEMLKNGNAQLGIPAAPKEGAMLQRLTDVQKSGQAFDSVAQELFRHKSQLLQGGQRGVVVDEHLSRLAMTDVRQASEQAQESVDELLVAVGSFTAQVGQEVHGIQRGSAIAFSVVIIVASLVAMTLGILVSRNIIRRIDRMVKALDQGSNGDLTVTVSIDSRDEIGRLGNDFNSMLGRLAEMVGKVNHSSQELTAISRNIFHASKRMMEAAELQVGGVNETSSAVTEINASIRGVAEGVDRLSVSAADSSSSVLQMAASVEEVAIHVEHLAESVEEVSSSIVEMAASIRQIDVNIAHLMENATTTASSVVEMDSSIRQIQGNALEAADISRQVLLDAQEGKSSVDATIAGMTEIRRSSGIATEVIKTLSMKAEDIGLILSVIDDVAEQTSLLALNAAIIAAQAGEHGKGFGVVADEIKELAERAGNSTREIAQIVKGVQEETRRAADAIGQAEQSVIAGERLSESSGAALSKIVMGVQKANTQVAEIARAAVEQAKGSRMIREAMETVSDMVEQISRASREQGKGGELIMAAVERMKGLTGQVRTSTREQSTAGGFISRTTEQILDMVQQIKRACDEQTKGSEQIVVAVHGIQESTEVNLEAARVMDDSVVRLTRQIDVLQNEMGNFTINKVQERGASAVEQG